jgi:hypothetical protein
MTLQKFKLLLWCLGFDIAENREGKKSSNLLPSGQYSINLLVTVSKHTVDANTSPLMSNYIISVAAAHFGSICRINRQSTGLRYLLSLMPRLTMLLINMEPYLRRQPDGPFQQSTSAFDVLDRLVSLITL